MQRQKKWFRVVIYVMLLAMIASTVLFMIEPFLAG
ncbi:stressosome-associated protein Prli42 [Paenibacillus sp. 19GGS1-52]|uniref:Stressosome-associated protein Prli42 n=1 Tax=Paenibacillus monticola TaxID=2666075 RepID=A0A7X2H4N1_9BACL|nr:MULTISPECIES: stressosome-associated protein Prli42 [Paenibacillus]MRN53519.1 stressosome-associated protein Prli42 [Paenibacillus monticola]ULO09179.1 stressosome-associated protein Prli42 [Paenibacillus sp. 19GGS1-52]